MKIAVIGAGMAGLTVARNLQSFAEVTVFDKSKGTGGRLSSRSFAEGWIDHGAPYFSADSQDFLDFLHTSRPGYIDTCTTRTPQFPTPSSPPQPHALPRCLIVPRTGWHTSAGCLCSASCWRPFRPTSQPRAFPFQSAAIR